MKDKLSRFRIFETSIKVLIFALLIVIIYKLNTYEKVIISIEEGRVSGISNIQKQSLDGNQQIFSTNNFGVSKNRKWLHPDAPNIVKNVPFFTPLPNSNYNTELTVNLTAEEKGYNYFVDYAGQIYEIHRYIGCIFARRDSKNPKIWVGDLAERVTLTNDGKDLNIYLKKGVKWQKPTVNLDDPKYAWLKGEHYVTAHDVKFTINAIMNPQVEAASLRTYFVDLAGVEVVDDYTVIVHWKKWNRRNVDAILEDLNLVYPEFLYAYDESGEKIPKDNFGLKFNNHWYNDRTIGCGPYRLKEHKENQYVLLERSNTYTTGPKPVPKIIKYDIIKDENLAYLKLKSGDLDVIENLSKPIYRDEILKKNPDSPFQNGKLKYITYTFNAYTYIGWNFNNPIFNNKLVRQAMTYATNRKFLVEKVYAGLGKTITCPIQPFYPEYDQSIKPRNFDLKKSKELLAKAGWKDKNKDGILEKTIDGKPIEFEFTLLITNRPRYKTIASRLKEDLRKVGIKMDINTVDWSMFIKKLDDRDFDAVIGGWGQDPTTALHQTWHSREADKPGSSNFISYRNKEVDEIADKVRYMKDGPERVALFHKAHEIFYGEQPYTFLMRPMGVAAYQSYLKGFIISRFQPHIRYFRATD